MSYLGLCVFPPPRVKIREVGGGTKTNHLIGRVVSPAYVGEDHFS